MNPYESTSECDMPFPQPLSQPLSGVRYASFLIAWLLAIPTAVLACYGWSWMSRYGYPNLTISNVPAFATIISPICFSGGLATVAYSIWRPRKRLYHAGAFIAGLSATTMLLLWVSDGFYRLPGLH